MADKESATNCFDRFRTKSENTSVELDNNSKIIFPPIYRFASKSIPTNEIYYKTNNKNMGIALVFNHYEFFDTEKKARIGSEYDTECIQQSLQNYGFEVRFYKNRILDEIEEIIEKVSKENHSNNDCLVVVVMTHGKKGELSAYDKSYPIENLWTPFFGDNCKTLINKPKLFFIQACRGFGLEEAIEYKDNENHVSEIISKVVEKDTTKTYIIPNSADILIMYSCYEGKSACRHPIFGTWFIQSISNLLDEYAEMPSGIDLYHFLTLVNQKVAYEFESNVKDQIELNKIKQMPNFTSTLTKLFLLKPKLKN